MADSKECKFAGTGKCCREGHNKRVSRMVKERSFQVEGHSRKIKPLVELKTELNVVGTWATNLRPSQELTGLWSRFIRLRGKADTKVFARIQTLMEGITIYSGTRQDCPLINSTSSRQ